MVDCATTHRLNAGFLEAAKLLREARAAFAFGIELRSRVRHNVRACQASDSALPRALAQLYLAPVAGHAQEGSCARGTFGSHATRLLLQRGDLCRCGRVGLHGVDGRLGPLQGAAHERRKP